jgi:hypothetical protein
MATFHALRPSEYLSLEEQNEFFQHYSGVMLEDFILSQGIEIQSKRTLRDGQERRYSPRYLRDTWEAHLRRFLAEPAMNLPQMLQNYRDEKTTNSQKREIYFKLKEIGMRGLSLEQEVEQESLMLGIAMMLSDNLDIQTSLIHTFEYAEEVVGVLSHTEKTA